MDRRDFLKTLGLLAVTAPAGIAALKQAPVAPEAPAPGAAMFADITKAAKESAATVGAMADSAFDCLDAMAVPIIQTATDIDWVPEVPQTHNGPFAGDIEILKTLNGYQTCYFDGCDWVCE